jgi:hypothetical protein
MKPESSLIHRRSFLKSAGPFALCLPIIARGQNPRERGGFTEADIPFARGELLKQVNTNRARYNLSQLQLDDLASQVATLHARDMVEHAFLSHWGSDGQKSYHRYCLAGGTGSVLENVSAAENIESVTSSGVLSELYERHESMLNETPPNDGHRQTILFPHHTHIGFGIALRDRSLRLVELYLARHLQLETFEKQPKPGSSLRFTGRVLNQGQLLYEVILFHEPIPTPPDLAWLRERRSVSLPAPYKVLRRRAPPGTQYVAGGTGEFDCDASGKFHVRVKLNVKKPGIYTMVFWLRRFPADPGFAGAEVCVLCC